MLLIVNPFCGDRTALSFVDHHVLPLLHSHNCVYKLSVTNAPHHAGLLASEYLSTTTMGEAVIVVAGGDGTLNEVVNGLLDANTLYNPQFPPIKIVILPLGTANALYFSFFRAADQTHPHYKLQSLNSYLGASSHPKSTVPLTIQSISVVNTSTDLPVSPPIFSVVVASTALHASILQTADTLRDRQDIVGIERFKVAAQQNISNWYHATVKVLPLDNVTLVYDPAIKHFRSTETPSPILDGPFEYFLSTVNVDRLESEFQITPLRAILPQQNTSFLELMIVRPQRHPQVGTQRDSAQLRALFVPTTTAVLTHAYKQGAHVDLCYDSDGTANPTPNSGLPIVEYYRCGGWEWDPMAHDSQSKIFCADGAIVSIDAQTKISCKVLSQEEQGVGICVCVSPKLDKSDGY